MESGFGPQGLRDTSSWLMRAAPLFQALPQILQICWNNVAPFLHRSNPWLAPFPAIPRARARGLIEAPTATSLGTVFHVAGLGRSAPVQSGPIPPLRVQRNAV